MEHRFIKNRDIVLFSLQSWDSDIAFNLKDMAYELARYNRVLFIDRARDRNTVLRNRIARKKEVPVNPLEKITERLWVLHPETLLESGNWAPTYRIFDFFNRINAKRLASEIKQTIHTIGFRNSLLINDNDFFRGLYLKSLLPIREYIFYLRDFLTVQPYFKKFGPRCEMEMIQKADLVVANSAYLAEHAGQWNPYSIDIGQGCDLADFILDGQAEPDDLKPLPRPVVGYCGAVTGMRLDENLLLEIARQLPAASLVFVGPCDETFKASPLRQMKNVYFLGPKKPADTSSYIRHFTLCINPQFVNPLTIGNYPRKIDEYLAMGKPVVATATQAMEMFRDFTFLCTTSAEYIATMKKVLDEPEWSSPQQAARRREFALTHSWENSVGALGDALVTSGKEYNPVEL